MGVLATPPRELEDPGFGEHFLRLAGDGDERGAIDMVTDLLDDGVAPQRVINDLIARTLLRVGRLWAADEWSIAREHAATATSERALAAVAARTEISPHRGRITVACVDGESHSMPPRLLAETLRLDGWRVDFLGAGIPSPHLVTHLHQTAPAAVALSCTIATRLPQAHAAITACRSTGVPVIAGGRGFGPDGERAERLGADAWALDAGQGVARLAQDWPPTARPHPASYRGDDEYTFVVRQRRDLLDKAVRRLAVAYPPMAGYDQREHDATVTDMRFIIDFLAAALYASDPRVFTDFTGWAAGVLGARGVPLEVLRIGLLLYRDQLREYPSSLAMLDEALTGLGR